MNRRAPLSRVLATLLVVALPLAFVPQTSAVENASLAGAVYTAADEQPIDGAVLHAGDILSGLIYSSTQTDDDGNFVLAGLPPAAYQLAIETDEGLYMVGSSVQLDAGQQREVQLELHKKTAKDPESAQEDETKGDMGFMNNPLFASLTVIGASILLGVLISEIDDRDQGLASPFTP
jgi:hypothetical protein